MFIDLFSGFQLIDETQAEIRHLWRMDLVCIIYDSIWMTHYMKT